MRLNNSTHMAVLQPLVNTIQIHGPKLRLLQASTIKIFVPVHFPITYNHNFVPGKLALWVKCLPQIEDLNSDSQCPHKILVISMYL